MKKIYKIMVFIMMLALAIGSIAISPVAIFATSAALVGASIVLTKMPTSGKINTTIKIPKGTTNTAGSQVTVKVTDPTGKEIETTENGDNYEFVAKMVGDYKVVYTASATENTSKTTSEVYTIKVIGEKATLTFAENSPFILKNKVGSDAKFVLPYPQVSITGEEDDKIDGHYAGESETDANIVVTVVDPAHNTWEENKQIANYVNPLGTKVIDGKKYYTFTPATKTVDGEQKTVYGNYVVYFKYTNAETNVVVTKSQKVLVSENYVDAGEVTFTWEGSLPESAVLGVETQLPKPVTTYKNTGDSVATYTKVLVSYNGGEEKEVENFKFTPMQEAKNGTYYTLTYKIYTMEQLDLANHTTLAAAVADADEAGKVLVKKYTIENVTDTQAPVVKAVNAYEVEENKTLAGETILALEEQEVSYLIPSKARTQVEIEIPAGYATDNYSEYKDLTITRTLIDENGKTYSLDGEGLLNATLENDELVVTDLAKPAGRLAKINQTAKVLFTMKGTYTIRYRATDKANNSKEVTYKIVVSDSLVDELAPYIVMPTIDNVVYPNDTLTFAEPTIVDYKDDHKNGATTTTTIDNNVKKDVYYFYGQVDDNTDFEYMLQNNQLTKVAKDANDTSKYAIVVDAEPTAKYLTVVARAEDDAKYSVGKAENNVAYEYKTVTIYNVEDDIAPTLETNLLNIAESLDYVYGQNQLVELNSEIQFKDLDNNGEDVTQNLVASLKVYDKNGNEINVRGLKFVYGKNLADENVFKIVDGQFMTTVAGFYQVVITATDLGGNSLVNSYMFEVNDTKAPTIEFEKAQTTMELGKTYKLPTPVVKDDGVVIENQALTQVVFGEDCPSYSFNQGTFEFTPKEEGTFTYYYIAKDANDNERKVLGGVITVSDTTAPVIVINETDEYSIPETAEYKDVNGNTVNVKLPLFTATDSYNGIKSLSVTVTDPDGDELNVETMTDHYEFTPNKNGTFKVTYKAVDNANKSTTQVYTIQIGDVIAPTLKGATNPGQFKVGDKLSIKLEDLSVVDDTDGTTAGKTAVNNGKLTVALVGPDNTTVELTKTNDVYTYDFATAGTYNLKYTVKDAAGNTDNVTYTFNVKANGDTNTIKEIAWGTVLIVASVALIAGVIVYFVRTRDVVVDKDSKKKEDNE